MQLLDLPDVLIQDSLAPFLHAADLLRMEAVSGGARSALSSDTAWARLCARHQYAQVYRNEADGRTDRCAVL